MLNEYLVGSIGQLHERARTLLGDISRELARKKHLIPEFHQLAQTCRNQVNDLVSDLQNLLTDPRFKRPNLQSIRLRAYKRIVAELDFIECVGVAALIRVIDEDRWMTRVVGEIKDEIGYPLIPPVVSCQSQAYFEAFPGLNLLAVPQKEVHFLLHLPDLYHELAHFILTEKNNPAVEAYAQALAKSVMAARGHVAALLSKQGRGPRGTQAKLLAWDSNWVAAWGIELYCDLFGAFAVGPAYGWAHLHLCAKRGGHPFLVENTPNSTHPADQARMVVILEALARLGYPKEAAKIEDKWKELLAYAGYKSDADYTICFPSTVLQTFADDAFAGYRGLNCKPSAPATGSTIHNLLNEAWERFWSAPDKFAAWEKGKVASVLAKP
jgi:hypothetical protein